jgi:hypothetical protein
VAIAGGSVLGICKENMVRFLFCERLTKLFDFTTDTILTPFSLSPTTDSAVDSLPKLFLAYCTLVDTDDVLSPND